jgi:hypothetical protein
MSGARGRRAGVFVAVFGVLPALGVTGTLLVPPSDRSYV